MNVLVVDTSIWISYFKGQSIKELDLALKEGRVYLPSIVASELMSGQMSNTQRTQLVAFLKELAFCNCDFEHWIRVGITRRKLAARGLTVSAPDAHIAQSTLDLEGYLLTEDQIFKRVEKLAPELKLALL